MCQTGQLGAHPLIEFLEAYSYLLSRMHMRCASFNITQLTMQDTPKEIILLKDDAALANYELPNVLFELLAFCLESLTLQSLLSMLFEHRDLPRMALVES